MRKGPHRRSARTKTCGKRYLVCLGKSRENKGSGEARVAGGGESRKIKDQTGKVLMTMVDSLDAQDRHTPILYTQVAYQGKDTSKKQLSQT